VRISVCVCVAASFSPITPRGTGSKMSLASPANMRASTRGGAGGSGGVWGNTSVPSVLLSAPSASVSILGDYSLRCALDVGLHVALDIALYVALSH